MGWTPLITTAAITTAATTSAATTSGATTTGATTITGATTTTGATAATTAKFDEKLRKRFSSLHLRQNEIYDCAVEDALKNIQCSDDLMASFKMQSGSLTEVAHCLLIYCPSLPYQKTRFSKAIIT